MSIYDDIGHTIVLLRKQKFLSQEKLALECEISPSYLRLIEHGNANPTINELLKIADALEIELLNPFVFHLPLPVTEFRLGQDDFIFPICPRCHISLDREFQAFCDRCGQSLSWDSFPAFSDSFLDF